jgi:hypothetical protein
MVNRTIQVTTNDATRVQVATSNIAQVRKITVGTPIRRVTRAAIGMDDLNNVDFSDLKNGSVMVYNSSTTNWTSTINLENQNISGGQY